MRNGELIRLKMLNGTVGKYMRKDIEEIEILNARGLLERYTLKEYPTQ